MTIHAGMYAPGIVGIAMGLLILLGVKDSPETAGFGSIEGTKQDNDGKKDPNEAEEQKESLVDLLINDVLKYVHMFHFVLPCKSRT